MHNQKTNFKCLFCNGQADRLMFYSKLYLHNGGTIENPLFSCPRCHKIAYDQLFQIRGGNEGVKTILFSEIGKYSPKRIGSLVSKKREINHLATVRWRKLIWRISFLWREPTAHHDDSGSSLEVSRNGI